MAKKRVTLRWIENERARKYAYKMRLETMTKKFDELCILCDLKGCMIVLSSDIKEPLLWPSEKEVKELLARFDSMSKFQQTQKMLSYEQYIVSRVEKLKEDVYKQETKNKKMEACILMHKILNGRGMQEITRPQDAELLKWYSMEKLKEVQHYKRCFPSLHRA